ncbi:VWA domain-containing protein [Pseudoteredinibacter isoporae]|uniref:Ca-activated chloride channel family protein n=1 Tax=Pseudoteredinibacter isoporae TaxID=570281 RepID=A0A7X0JUI9_9GAMM|nr:VWA domain-containing protein [Pseudoteredinibacter isoporae]MBB6521636.1 Ca-activated chloride channel family protein [Pseudoteredinibacter isoporae]NHO87190.1 VWA domain-containing protein [Pseudoteredinibacter isoporae]NIB23014.1 VWA domain-containing protein [Pseudoteredinibacter isoporae]
MDGLNEFHFLRPWALMLIPTLALMVYFAQRQLSQQSAWKQWVDPQLLSQMLVHGDGKQWRFPWWLAALLLSAGAIGLAGPSWEKLPQPVIQKQNALIVILDLSPSMNSQDIKPSRLDISRFKLIDLLKQRKEGQTGLVAYAGEAHVVTPLTDDVETIINLLPVLKPGLMPIRGSNVEAGIGQAIQLLKDSGLQSGDILLLSDGVAEQALGNIEDQLSGSSYRLSVMSVGTEDGGPIPSGQGFMKDSQGNIVIAKTDTGTMRELARENGGLFVQLQAGEQDLQRLNQFWQQDLSANDMNNPEDTLGDREFDQWQDNGHWFALALLLFFPFAFRRGGLLALLPTCILSAALSSLPTSHATAQETATPKPQPAEASQPPSGFGEAWKGLWQTPNQRGMDAYKEQDYQRARELFEDPQWQASSDYENGNFDAAAKAFAKEESAEGQYNLGNALAQSGDFDGAIKAYDEALKQKPDFEDAKFNKELMEKLKLEQEQQEQEQQQSDQNQESQDNQEQDGSEQQQKQDQSGQQENQDQQESDTQQENQQNEEQDSQSQEPQSQNQQSQEEQETDQSEQQEQQAEQQEGEENENQQEAEQQAQADINPDDLSDEEKQALEQWLKQVPDDPSGLLRRKFLYEQRQKQIAYRNGQLELPDNDAHKRY